MINPLARLPLRLPVPLLALLALLASGPAAAQEAVVDTLGGPALSSGDLIRLVFSREIELGGDFVVDETGSTVLPLIGMRAVVGIPAGTLRLGIRRDYAAELRNQEVQILFLHRVSVLGAVTNPGLYHVDATMSLGDALALAGGPRTDGRPEELLIRRDGAELATELQLSAAVGERVRSGDQLFVPQKSWLSRNSVPVLGGLLSATAILLSRGWF